jgi:succinate dehydrogenase hydrophobic anchor subunit
MLRRVGQNLGLTGRFALGGLTLLPGLVNCHVHLLPGREVTHGDDTRTPRREPPSGRTMTEPKVLRRGWTTAEGWRDTKLGMWAWLIQRAAAVVLLVAIAAHLVNPFRRGVQALLLALALLHALLGVRALLLDVGVPLRWHRALFALALVLAAILFAVVWTWRWY